MKSRFFYLLLIIIFAGQYGLASNLKTQAHCVVTVNGVASEPQTIDMTPLPDQTAAIGLLFQNENAQIVVMSTPLRLIINELVGTYAVNSARSMNLGRFFHADNKTPAKAMMIIKGISYQASCLEN